MSRYTGFDYIVRAAMGTAEERRNQPRRDDAPADVPSRRARRSSQRSR